MTTSRYRIVWLASTLAVFAMACQSRLLPANDTFASLSQDKETALPRADPAAVPAAPSADSVALPVATIEGTIELAKSLEKHAKPQDTVYVMARDGASQRMLAVTRLFVPADPKLWPLHFRLEDARLLRDTPVSLSVRIDKDGDATTKQAGDLVGTMAGEVTAPLANVRIVVDQTL